MKPLITLIQQNKALTLAFCAVALFCLGIHLYTQWDTPRFEASLQTPPPVQETHGTEPNAKPAEPTQAEHFHADGTFHPEPHEEIRVPGTAPPGAATTPDFPAALPNEEPVITASKRLDYIKNNPYAWSGVHSPRATELIAQLMPPPVLRNEGHGEAIYELTVELIAQSDPRATEVLIANMCEGDFSGVDMEDALEEIGPQSCLTFSII